jgi:NAD(P)H-hydrate epimerase
MNAFSLSRDEVREIDRRSIEEFGVPGIVLMENAGRGCAELLMRLNLERKPVAILCGPGNNGGDGFVIARHLDNSGWPVTVAVFAEPESVKGDALANLRICEASKADIHWDTEGRGEGRFSRIATHSGWIVDALFGTGLSRALSSPFDELVSIVNASRNPILAVDIPSGLDCDTGEPLGPTIRAAHTATFVAHKRGFANPESRKWTGEIHVVDIGAPRVLIEEYRK